MQIATAFIANLEVLSRQREVHKAFRKLDKDSNGFITAQELKTAIMASLDEKIKEMISEADVDGDGRINVLEFEKVYIGPSSHKICQLNNSSPLEPPKPPDGGWGWVIVFASFMCNFIVGNPH